MRSLVLALIVLAVPLLAEDGTEEMDLSGWVLLGKMNSPMLAQSDADIISAEAGVRSAGAFLWPSLTFHSSGGHSWSSMSDGSGGFVDTDNSSWSMSMTLSQELLGSGGRNWLLLEGSRHSRTAAEHEYRGAELELIMDIVEGYYGVIEAERTLASARRALDRSRQQASRTASLYSIGGATNLEMIQAEVQFSRDSLTVLQKRQGLDASYASLYNAAGVVGSDIRVDTAAVLQPISIDAVMDLELDLSANPSMAASIQYLEESRLSLEAGRRLLWPSLSAGAGWSWSNDRFEFGDLEDRDSWNASVSLNWTLFDGFSRESRIQSSRASLLRQEASFQTLENSLVTSAVASRDILVSSLASLDLAGQVTEQAREQLRLSELSYSLGGISLLDLLQAQQELAEAEASEVTALTSCLIAEARLLTLLGQVPRLGE